ncbi:MAG TPA: carbon-nitrogen hydrolase family protein [Patescibacteria group bacterium]|nr:carbon-nitrogen hydrolase family protein [Patescibacteria group bacterium]
MKIAAAQIRPFKGDIQQNIGLHKKCIDLAVSHGADAIFFPELSLTNYEPALAHELASTGEDVSFNEFQQLSDTCRITIAVGMPTRSDSGILISMIIFQKDAPRQTYSKQFLHEDELPFFIPGNKQAFLKISNMTVTPAICYESLLPAHAENAFKNGADVYVASVAKSANGVEKAQRHYPEVARRFLKPVVMINSIGPCDNFYSVGTSSVWNSAGELVGQLDDKSEGLLIFDTATEEVTHQTLSGFPADNAENVLY